MSFAVMTQGALRKHALSGFDVVAFGRTTSGMEMCVARGRDAVRDNVTVQFPEDVDRMPRTFGVWG
jgi:hypothetical protein